jgi:hypothetical protein
MTDSMPSRLGRRFGVFYTNSGSPFESAWIGGAHAVALEAIIPINGDFVERKE